MTYGEFRSDTTLCIHQHDNKKDCIGAGYQYWGHRIEAKTGNTTFFMILAIVIVLLICAIILICLIKKKRQKKQEEGNKYKEQQVEMNKKKVREITPAELKSFGMLPQPMKLRDNGIYETAEKEEEPEKADKVIYSAQGNWIP